MNNEISDISPGSAIGPVRGSQPYVRWPEKEDFHLLIAQQEVPTKLRLPIKNEKIELIKCSLHR